MVDMQSGNGRRAARERAFTLTVETADGPVAVDVTRKRVKNLNLRVRGDGSVAASAPLRTGTDRIQEFLDGKAAWIATHVARRRGCEAAADGTVPASYPLWGRPVPTNELLGCAAGRGEDGGPERAAADRLVADRYRSEVERALPPVVARLEERMGVHASRWQVRSMKTRWGSCTPASRSIRINARLAAYPPECLEFVVAHELCHLMEPSHNKRFHALLDIYCPANREASALLRR